MAGRRWPLPLLPSLLLLLALPRNTGGTTSCVDPRQLGALPGRFTPYDLHWRANTDAVQRALDAAAAGANGTRCVALRGGDYVTSGIVVPSHVVFRVEAGARIVAAANHTTTALVHVLNAQGVEISGGGVIYGSAERYISYYQPDPDDRFEPVSPDGSRPRLVKVEGSTDVAIRGVRIHNASDWSLHIRGSRRVLVDGVDVRGSWQFPNNDGIDPDSSVDVTIVNSNVDVADDGICPKASAGAGPLRNLLVRDCTVRSKSHALKFGSNTDEEMSGIVFDRVTIRDSNSGIAIQQRSGGDIHNVTWSNIDVETRYVASRWWGNGEWLWFTSEARNPGDRVGRLYDLLLVNVTARSENGGLISGRANGVHNVTLRNVSVTIAAWTNYSAEGVRLCTVGGAPHGCQGTEDHRPSYRDVGHGGREAGRADGVRLQNAQGARLEGVSVTFENATGGRRPAWAGRCVTADADSGPVWGLDRVTCVNG